MEDDPTRDAKYVFIRWADDTLTVDYADCMSPHEAWAFLTEATDMVREQIDGVTEDAE